ncbi:hypothetical protein EDB83DRAFT_753447 [Lactarius deliciosus]|nr:hypothetical protein EDB83DRAFT_753447 [Lactarius deliciosus]
MAMSHFWSVVLRRICPRCADKSQVDGFLYCVHRYFFSRDSVYFSTRFTQLGVRDHEASSTVVSLGDVKRKDFEAFLTVLYPDNFEGHDLSYEQWRSVLNLSTRWGFASLRKLALRSITPPTSYDRLALARTYAVEDWIVPALTALCERKAPLSLDEARGMSIEDVVLVATMREDIRSTAVRPVRAAEISRLIEAMQVGTPVPAADNEVSSAGPTPAATEDRPTACPPEGDIGTAKLAGGEIPMSGWSAGWNFATPTTSTNYKGRILNRWPKNNRPQRLRMMSGAFQPKRRRRRRLVERA